jgi:hypothetical protein
MAQNARKQQKAVARQKAKHRQKVQGNSRSEGGYHAPPRAELRLAASWPVHECLIPSSWQKEGEIVQVLFARQAPTGKIAAASFRVDLGCLGVKNAMAGIFSSQSDYEQRIRSQIAGRQALRSVDPNMGARIVAEAVRFAGELGFRPHRDYEDAAILLEGLDPAASDVVVPLGRNGRPLFVGGPYDDYAAIIAKLEKAVGPGNYDAMAPIGAPGSGPDEDALDVRDFPDPAEIDEADLDDVPPRVEVPLQGGIMDAIRKAIRGS